MGRRWMARDLAVATAPSYAGSRKRAAAPPMGTQLLRARTRRSRLQRESPLLPPARAAPCAPATTALAEFPDLPFLLTDRRRGDCIGTDDDSAVRMSNPHRLPAGELDSVTRPRADGGSPLAPVFGAGSERREFLDLEPNFCFLPKNTWSAPADSGLKCICRALGGEREPFHPATDHCELRGLAASVRHSGQRRR